MKRKLPAWCKEAKKSLIDNDMTVKELSDELGFAREYVSRVVNGSVYAPDIAAKIGKRLRIKVSYPQNIF